MFSGQNYELCSYKQWELMKSLGRGGFGEVYHYRHRETHIDIAVKRLKENNGLTEDEEERLKKRWELEERYVRDFKTPNCIVGWKNIEDREFLDYLNSRHAWKPLPVITMEYCNGGDLRAHMQRPENMNGLEEFEVREILRSLRNAIEYLHNVCKIEHRDLKPDNILIHREDSGKRCYKLTDFGFARPSTDQTMLQSVVGTRNYFAPEIVITAKYTKTVDYWSMGVIAFEMICGILPFLPHHPLPAIISNLNQKPRTVVAITENPINPGSIQWHKEVFDENRLSRVFKRDIERWLPMALDRDHRARGTLAPTASDEVHLNMKAPFYDYLDVILEKKILKVFCLNTMRFYEYDITRRIPFLDLLDHMERDISEVLNVTKRDFYFSFPVGHHTTALTANTTAMDLYEPEWLDPFGDRSPPPAMLYVICLRCDYNADKRVMFKHDLSYMSETIREYVEHDAKMDAPMPEWILVEFERHTHFLLSNEERHLQAMLHGIREYAISVENEMVEYDTSVRNLPLKIKEVRGRIDQFKAMIDSATKTYETPNTVPFFRKWQKKAKEKNNKINEIGTNIAEKFLTPYKKTLSDLRVQVENREISGYLAADNYSIGDFRRQLSYRLSHSERIQNCKEMIHQCLDRREQLLPPLHQIFNGIVELHKKYCEIKEDGAKAIAALNAIVDDLLRQTDEFLTGLAQSHSNGLIDANDLQNSAVTKKCDPSSMSLQYDSSLEHQLSNIFLFGGDTEQLTMESLNLMEIMKNEY